METEGFTRTLECHLMFFAHQQLSPEVASLAIEGGVLGL